MQKFTEKALRAAVIALTVLATSAIGGALIRIAQNWDNIVWD
jgi:hypothetical protein